MIQLAPTRPRLPHSPSDIAIEDCALLLSAVKARLQLIVGDFRSPTNPPLMQIHASVLECVVALNQLHTTLTNELSRRQQLELAVFEVQNALDQVRTELVIAARCSLCTAHPTLGAAH